MFRKIASKGFFFITVKNTDMNNLKLSVADYAKEVAYRKKQGLC